jgi:hypothetical protein
MTKLLYTLSVPHPLSRSCIIPRPLSDLIPYRGTYKFQDSGPHNVQCYRVLTVFGQGLLCHTSLGLDHLIVPRGNLQKPHATSGRAVVLGHSTSRTGRLMSARVQAFGFGVIFVLSRIDGVCRSCCTNRAVQGGISD